MKKGTEKENLFSDEERVILSNFINKILKHIRLLQNPKEVLEFNSFFWEIFIAFN